MPTTTDSKDGSFQRVKRILDERSGDAATRARVEEAASSGNIKGIDTSSMVMKGGILVPKQAVGRLPLKQQWEEEARAELRSGNTLVEGFDGSVEGGVGYWASGNELFQAQVRQEPAGGAKVTISTKDPRFDGFVGEVSWGDESRYAFFSKFAGVSSCTVDMPPDLFTKGERHNLLFSDVRKPGTK
ncbi:MAG: hypothetical protein ABIH11_03105 [Candidatus Altiarchaeota archaeon]